MAKKKKRGAPETPCEKCGKPKHPRALKCPHCGFEKPAAPPEKKVAPMRKVAAPKPTGGSDLKSALKAEKAAIDTLLE